MVSYTKNRKQTPNGVGLKISHSCSLHKLKTHFEEEKK